MKHLPFTMILALSLPVLAAVVCLAMPETSSGARMLVSAVLLLPVAGLSRFLGCSLFVDDNPPIDNPPIQLAVRVPNPGGGGTASVAAQMHFDRLPDFDEIDMSPFDIGFDEVMDQELVFRTTSTAIPLGSYRVRCELLQGDNVVRTGMCSGNLDEEDLTVFFVAHEDPESDDLIASLCFEPEPGT